MPKSSDPREKLRGVVALVLLALVFATMGVWARFLDQSFDLFAQTYLRIGLAFLLGAALFWRKISWQNFRTLGRRDAAILTIRAVLLYLGIVIFTEALITTHYANATLIVVMPLLPIFGYFLLREKIKLSTVAWILLGFFGAALVGVKDFSTLSFGQGEAIALAALVVLDLSYVARRWHSDHLNNYETTVFMFLVGAIFLFLTSITLGENLPAAGDFGPAIVGVLAVSALFNVANLFLTNYGFERVKVAVAGNILTLEVVFALFYGLFLFHEIPSPREMIGGAMIFASVLLVNRAESSAG